MRLPIVTLAHLDDLWFQVTGTLCNLACTHCFISCTPHNRSFGFLDIATIQRYLEESVPLGVREYYFTGGEPFLHPDMTAILELTLRYGPATVLTNGRLFNDAIVGRLRAAEDASLYSLEFRVSIDGYTRAENDAIRGHGTFDRILAGIRQLLEYDFLPIITVTQTRDKQNETELFDGFVHLMKENGYSRPRIKILPTLRIGAEAERRRGYHVDEWVSVEMLEGFDQGTLLCNHARIVSERGVHVCPILLEATDSLLGGSLADAGKPFAVRHQACFTCYQYGTICSNPTSLLHNA